MILSIGFHGHNIDCLRIFTTIQNRDSNIFRQQIFILKECLPIMHPLVSLYNK